MCRLRFASTDAHVLNNPQPPFPTSSTSQYTFVRSLTQSTVSQCLCCVVYRLATIIHEFAHQMRRLKVVKVSLPSFETIIIHAYRLSRINNTATQTGGNIQNYACYKMAEGCSLLASVAIISVR